MQSSGQAKLDTTWPSLLMHLGDSYSKALAPLPLQKRGVFSNPRDSLQATMLWQVGHLASGSITRKHQSPRHPPSTNPTPTLGPRVGTAVAVGPTQTDTANLSLKWAPALPPPEGQGLASQPSTICPLDLKGPAQSGGCPLPYPQLPHR